MKRGSPAGPAITAAVAERGVADPKQARGPFFPCCRNGAAGVDQSLCAAIMEAGLRGSSARKADDLVKARGADSEPALGAGGGAAAGEADELAVDRLAAAR